MLLIGGSNRIVITSLNGTGLQPLRSLSANGTLSLDFQHSHETVCWVLSTESSGQLRCAETRNLRGFTREQEIRTQRSLQCRYSVHSRPLVVHFTINFTGYLLSNHEYPQLQGKSKAHTNLSYLSCVLFFPHTLFYLQALLISLSSVWLMVGRSRRF